MILEALPRVARSRPTSPTAVSTARARPRRQGWDWIAIAPPIARKHAPFIGEFLVSLLLAKIGTNSLTL
jgi:hypothetical protein